MSHFYRIKPVFRQIFTHLIVLFALLGFSQSALAQSTVSPANAISNFCTGTTQTLSPIIVSETAANNFSIGSNVTFIITSPANFQFDPTVPAVTITTTGGELVLVGTPNFASSTELRITFNVNNVVSVDRFQISGLKITANAPSSSGDIKRISGGAGGGTMVIAGQANTNSGYSYGFVQSVDPLSITTQPSSHSACQNTGTFFNIVATGNGLSYQWQVDNGGGFVDISAAGTPSYSGYTSSTLNIGSVNGLNLYKYRVNVTSTCAAATPSSNGILTVDPIPVVTQQPDVSVCSAGNQSTITFANSVGATAYNWTVTNFAALGLPSGSDVTDNIPGWTFPANTSGADITGVASVTATKNSCTSAVMTFTITLKARPVLTLPSPVVVCSAAPVSVVWSSNVAGSVTSWTNDNALIGLGASGSGDISFTSSPNNTGSDLVANISATSSFNGCTSAPVNFTITVKPTPVVVQSPNVSGCPGAGQAAIVFTNNAGATVYSWSVTNAAAIGVAASGVTNTIGGFTYGTNNTGSDIVGVVTVTATLNTCTSAVMTFTITLKARPVLTVPSPVVVCSAAPVSVVWSSNVAGSVTSWTNDNALIGLGASGSGDISFTSSPNNTGSDLVANISATSSFNGCTSAPVNFTITVKPTPVVAQSPNVSGCPGAGQAAIVFTNNAGATVYSWSVTNAAAIGVAASGVTNTIGGFTYGTNNTGSDIVGVVTVTATLNTCTSAVMTFTITLKARPVLTLPSPVVVCSAAPVSVVWSSNVAGSVTSWTNDNALIGLGASGSGDISFTSSPNNTGSDLVANISATSSFNGCTSAPVNFTITVKPTPVVVQSPNVSGCPGAGQAAIVFTNNAGATVYSWSVTNAAAIGVAASGVTNTIGGFTYGTNNTGSDIVGVVTVTATLNTCTSAVMTFTITLKARPVLTVPSPVVVCSAAPVSVVWSSNVAGSVTSWTNDNALIGLGASGSGDISFTSSPNNTGSDLVANISATSSFNGCTSAPVNFTITVKPTPVVAQSPNVSGCPGAGQAAIVFTNNAGATVYSWSVTNAAAIGVAASGVTNTIGGFTYGTNNTGSDIVGVVTVTATLNTCTSAVMTFTITLKARPVLTLPSPVVVCSAAPVSVVWSSNVAGSVTSWTNDNALIGLGASGSGDISFTSSPNNTGSDLVANISATSSFNGCTSAPVNFTITVKPTPVVAQSPNVSGCPGAGQAAIVFTNNAGATVYSWSVTNAAAIGVAASGVTNTIGGFTYGTNNTGSDIVGVVTVTATLNTCTSAVMTFTITLKARPVLTLPSPVVVCSAAPVSVVWSSNVAGSVTSWTNDNALIGLGASGSGDISFTSSPNNTGSDLVANISATSSFNGCTSAPVNFTITVKPTPVVAQSPNVSGCPGAGQAAIVFTNNAGATVYSWSVTNAAAIGVAASGVTSTIGGFTYGTNNTGSDIVGVVTVTATLNTCTSAVMTFTITLKARPVLTLPSPVVVCSAAPVSVVWSSNVAGSVTSWTNDNALIGLGASGSGDISFTSSPNNTGSDLVANISATSSFNGCTSAPVNFTITVKPTPVVAQSPNVSGCPGAGQAAIVFTNNAGATVYSWSVTNAAAIGVAASGVTSTIGGFTYGTNNTGSDIVGVVTVTATLNTCTSAVMTFTITLKARPVLTVPSPVVVCSAAPVSVVWSSNVAGSVTSWTNDNALIGLGASGSGDISFTSSPNNTGSDLVANISATSSFNGCTSAPVNFTITVKPTPVVVQSPNVSGCPGAGQAAIVFTNNAGATVYSWSVTNAAAIGVAASGVTSTIGGFTYGTNNTGSDIVGVVTVTATLNTCTSAVMTFNISLKAKPVLNPQGDVAYCTGDPISIPFVSNAAGSTITWTNSNSAIGIGSGGSGDLNFTAPANNTSSNVLGNITVLASRNGCVSAPLNFTITIRPTPQFTITNTTTNICEGTPTNITLNSITSNAVITLTSINYGGGSGTLSPGATFTDGQKITEVINNPTNTQISVVYTFSVAANSCSNPVTQSRTVVVRPTPSANALDAVICTGQNAIVVIDGSPKNVPGTTFDWTVTASSNVVGASNGNGSTINQLLSLTNSFVGTVQYHITPTASACPGPVKTITVTINPVPTVDAGVDYQVCQPATIPLSGTIGGAATSGTWIKVSGAGTVSSSITSGNIVTATYSANAADVSTTIVLRLETNDPDGAGPLGPCSLASDLLNIQINRAPTVSVPADYTVCEPVSFSATPISLSGTIGGSATTGLWSVVTGNGGLSATNISGSTVTASYVIGSSDVGTTVTFRLTSNDPDGLGPCTSISKNINIHINPRVILSAGPDLALCRDTPFIALQGSATGAPTTVLWTGGAGTYSNSTSPTSNYTFNTSEVATTFVLTLTGADPDGSGPTGPCPSVSDQMNLTVNPLPVVNIFGLPSTVAENIPPFPVSGNQAGGLFTITPATSNIGSTSIGSGGTDQAFFDPSAVTLGFNSVIYNYTNPANGCKNSTSKGIVVNPVTSIDFALQYSCPGPSACPFVPVNGSGEFELCADVGSIKLVGNPAAPTGLVPTNFVGVGPNAAILQAKISAVVIGGPNADFFLNTNGLPSDTYLLQYNYTNSNGDPSTPVTRSIKVFASPKAAILPPPNNCITASIILKDNSTMSSPNPYSGAITGWVWNFGDNTSGSGSTTSHDYSATTGPGDYNVSLEVTTFQGCKSSSTWALRVGPKPTVDFSWSAICTNDSTRYADLTNSGISVIKDYKWEFGDGDILTGNAGASVPPGTDGGRTSGTLKNPKHNYTNTGVYSSKLTVNTFDGCTNSITQNVFILTAGVTVTPLPTNPYTTDFEGGSGGNWIAEGLRTSASTVRPEVFSPISWIYGTPSGATIKSASSGSTAWWTGYNIVNNGQPTYFDDEQSAVNGPCFDLRNLKRPMISLDYWSDAEKNLDGAVIQYSTDGGLNWKLVGPLAGEVQRDQGINWYDPNATIVSNPGQQLIGQYGWTDKSAGWKNGRFNLDMVAPGLRNQVRLRVAFSSNNQNASGNTYDGFAFDNIYVGDKMRNVLVEHFTNSTLNSSLEGDDWINSRYQDQIALRGVSDFDDIQYHISYPSSDPLNLNNTEDPSARALFFGVSQPPASLMDGVNDGVKFKGRYTDITTLEIDRRALKEPLFDLTLENVATSNTNMISVKLTMKARKAVNTPLIAQVVLVENQVGTFKNVMRKQLMGAGGETITLPFNVNDVLVKSATDIQINVPIVDPTQTKLVAYVQDKITREIYQSVVIPITAPYKTGGLITGLESEAIPTTLNGIAVYPNPASGSFYFKLPDNRPSEGFTWKLIDQRGATLKSGDFDNVINNSKQVDISEFSNGIYIIMLSGPGGSVVYNKIVVMNHN